MVVVVVVAVVAAAAVVHLAVLAETLEVEVLHIVSFCTCSMFLDVRLLSICVTFSSSTDLIRKTSYKYLPSVNLA